MRKKRNYFKILNEFLNLNTPLEIKIVNSVHYGTECFPMFYFYHHTKGKKDVVLFSGVHGNESIGVKVMLKFLQEFKKEWLDTYNFVIFPVINAYGYAFDTRYNGNKIDINRHAYTAKPSPTETQEFKILDDEIPDTVSLFIDLHQDGKKDFYVYEKRRPTEESLAKFGMEAIKKQNIKIDQSATIYGEKCENGVVNSIREKNNTMEDWFFNKGCRYSITVENPDKSDDEELIRGSLAFLTEVLNKFKEIR